MARGEEKLAAQVGQVGYFGKVAVEAEPVNGDGEVTVDFDPRIPERWRSGTSFGVEYVLDRVSKRKLFPNGGRVRIVCIEGHEVDTNNVVIAFVAAHALYKALELRPAKQPLFDENTGVFSFPK